MKYLKYSLLSCGLCAMAATLFSFSCNTSRLIQQPCQSSWLSNLQEGDTLRINYSVASGELGSVHEGILITKRSGQLKADHVLYDYGIEYMENGLIKIKPESNLIPLSPDSIKAFFHSIKNDYRVENESMLNDSQVCQLKRFFDEAEKFDVDEISNAAEYYAILSKGRELVVIDRSGRWRKHSELKRNLFPRGKKVE